MFVCLLFVPSQPKWTGKDQENMSGVYILLNDFCLHKMFPADVKSRREADDGAKVNNNNNITIL